jgi:flagellar basal-body rod modification protein FlgD
VIEAIAATALPAEIAPASSLAENFDTFLLLLTTQLKNQDPLEPLRTEEFTQQLATFTGVEQAISTNKKLDELLSVYQAGYAANLVNYLGQTVTAKGEITALKQGQANWSYELADAAAGVTLSVFDQNGKLIWSGAGATEAGTHAFLWDGKDAAGVPQPEGLYRLKVEAKDANGTAIPSLTIVKGVVDGIEAVSGVTFLSIGGLKVPLGDVLSVHVTTDQNPV